ncbi:MAG: SoxR reducing system RseC family protein [Candidatus Cloacimonetes bacterium]|jgi:sigma-E factor negative regulatory protein RseC|nr:SoxR reducing system RseC family protein [Candidatus Cloacimonadota bacterium]MDD2506817.1 SoxR reducing system RseC family protein [Candidatus Cloacimonadota bacterium]MDD4146998.1 SoxR reducing system RseC family protein [Candidatus Cloacimonadota bacterium]MDD4560025.1 SoxR reducing system RseC family protein [Candidatus Cloacimonadota bacterium]
MSPEEIQDTGIVTSVSGNTVVVELQRGNGCKSCAMHGLCFSKGKAAFLELESSLKLEIGDSVELEISPSGRVLASLLIFIVPIVFLFIGFLLANIWMNELSSIILAFASMALSFFIIRLCDNRWGKKLKIEIVRKL